MKFIFYLIVLTISLFVVPGCVKSPNNPVVPAVPPTTDSSHDVKNIRINPTTGSFNDTVNVYATNINYTDSVMFNGVRGRIVGHTGDSLQLIVPFSAGPGPVSISYGNGKICVGPAYNYVYSSYVTTIAGTGISAEDNPDGLAIHASLYSAYSIAPDDAENVFVAEAAKIRKITPDGFIHDFSGTGAAGSADGPANTAQFAGLFSIVFDKVGNLYVADEGGNKIRKIDPAGNVSTLAGSGAKGNLDGPGNTATFNTPYGATVDPNGNILVADTYNHLIRKITPAGIVTTVAMGPIHQFVDGKDTLIGALYGPTGICTDMIGNIYISDGSCIRKVATDGTVTTIAGDNNAGDVDGTGHDAKFSYAIGIVYDSKGAFYIADWGAEKIKKLTPDGVVTTIAGVYWPSISNEFYLDGPALKAKFYSPFGIAIDKTGNLYVADYNDYRIRKITFQ